MQTDGTISCDMIESYKYTYDECDNLINELHTVTFPKNTDNSCQTSRYIAEDGTMVTEFMSDPDTPIAGEKFSKIIAAFAGCAAGLLLGRLLSKNG